MASIKIPMNCIDSISMPDLDDNSIVIDFKTVGDCIPHAIHIADPNWTLVVKDDMLLIEK